MRSRLDEIRIGAGCTYTDLRRHEIIGREFPLLQSAARWTGGVANQNRGTIGGNIVNASPAADSLPALLVYDAELILVSVRGERRLPYASFHTGYKKTLLAADELLQAVCLPRRFSGYFSHARKVGARNAQAISKVCIAALGRMADGVVEDVRIALGSVAPVPLRLTETEQTVRGKAIDSELLLLARKAVAAEIRPIDDIRSTARYRAAVAGNLVAEFLNRLRSERTGAERGASAGCPGTMESSSDRRSHESDSALLRIQGLGAGNSCAKTVRGRSCTGGCVGRNVAQSDAIRLDGGVPQSSANRGVARLSLLPGQSPPAQSVEWSAQEQRNVEDADADNEDCSGGGKSRI